MGMCVMWLVYFRSQVSGIGQQNPGFLLKSNVSPGSSKLRSFGKVAQIPARYCVSFPGFLLKQLL